MTTPDIFATGEDATNSFFNAPSGQGDSPRLVTRTATVPGSSSIGTVIGLVPFNKGFSMAYGSSLAVDDLDTATNVTLNWGYVYNDNVTNVNDVDAFAAAATTAQAGGVLFPSATAGATFEALADGWITVTIAGGATTTEGDITFNGLIAYGI